MLLVTTALSGLLAGIVPASAVPQAAPQTPPPVTRPAPVASAPVEEDEEAYDLGTVTVTGSRPRGAVDTDIEPELSLSADQIQAYGAANISELLAYLEPVTRSSQGRDGGQPVLLVNGRRISGFREIQSIPTEAIERTDILPEEVALQFGYRADQRVVNFVLKANFRSISAEAAYRAPTQGGRTTTELESTLFNIAGGNRYSVDAEYSRSSPLFESERDIERRAADLPAPLFGDPADQGAYRTLLSQSEQLQARGSIKRDLNSTTQGTLSVSLENTNTRSFNGLPGVVIDVDGVDMGTDETVFRYLDAPASLGRKTDTLTANVGTVLDGFIGEEWRWTFSGNYDRVETDTFTGRGYGVTPFQDRVNAGDPTADPFGTVALADFAALAGDTANSVSQSLGAELVLTGDLYDLPAGGISSTFKLGADTRSLDSTSVRSGITTERSQSRDRFTGSGSFTFPIADRGQGVLPFLGDLSVNFNAGYEELSDFGGLPVVGVGLNWSPIEPLSFLVSYTDEQGAPSISQLNDPIVRTFDVPVFDFRANGGRGETVFVTRTDGGNPDLDSDNRRVFKLGATLRPFDEQDFSLSSTWTVSRTDDVIAGFPTITPELEAALPERFERAEPVGNQTVGTLLSFDARALNYDSAERQDIRTGFNFSKAFGTPNPAAAGGPGMRGPGGGGGPRAGGPGGGGPRAGGPPGGGAVRFGGGGGRGRGGGMQPGQGRFNLSIYHTYRIQDEIVIRDGLPVIDLLDGGATGSRGGSPRHEIQAQGGVFRNGMGAFVNANWRDSTTVGDTLRFSNQTTINLNMFVDLGQQRSLVQRFGWLEGSRLNLGFQNIFDTRTEVSTLDGTDVPLNYQADYLDPQGRTISLTFRKILF
ncbi:MAG: TonB-dependent receptor [Brevundimonas sp.]|uniref:TonB-dependent receptor n=1 Tax=Brevundimonas sp. TaxID=1871086 RepID=UPI001A35CE57|nr:TonB-dependent receptor [Brevundimonas sp.]MBJ7448423.1 TonB-dependent receptor [Brevundimonas sp.]